jgi:RNA recognition motif-containing protein
MSVLADMARGRMQVQRVFLAKDGQQKSRGFAFVSFFRKEDADRAMEKLQVREERRSHGLGLWRMSRGMVCLPLFETPPRTCGGIKSLLVPVEPRRCSQP